MKTIGSYTIRECVSLFGIFGREYYKNGELVGTTNYNNGETKLCHTYSWPFEFSRARAYRVWKKHFPDYYDFQLPEAIQKGLEREPESFGEFYSKKHKEWWGYEG